MDNNASTPAGKIHEFMHLHFTYTQFTALYCRSLGQNFMEDDDVLRAIVERAGLSEESMVIEVGPGTGAMTRYIMDQGAWMTVIEKDDRLYEELVQQFGSGEVCGVDRHFFLQMWYCL